MMRFFKTAAIILAIVVTMSLTYILLEYKAPIFVVFKGVSFNKLTVDVLTIIAAFSWLLTTSIYVIFSGSNVFGIDKFFEKGNLFKNFKNIFMVTLIITLTVSSFIIFNLEQLNALTLIIAVVGIFIKMSMTLFNPTDKVSLQNTPDPQKTDNPKDNKND